MANIPFGDPGVAGFQSDEFGQIALMAGDTPAWADQSYVVATATVDLPLYSVVGFNAAGEVIPALTGSVAPEDDVQAVGFTAAAFVDGSGTRKVKVCRQAHVFVDALVWPASYDTDAKRLKAFEGAPSPTAIIASKHPYVPAV